MAEQLTHTRSCDALTPGETCSCCLKERQNTQTAMEIYAAWRKRAEEAEQERSALIEILRGALQPWRDEDAPEPHAIGRIAYVASAKVTGCAQPWDQANQAKWNAAAMAVLAWACHELDEEAEYGCPCNEDERVAWELTDKLRELGGLPRRDSVTPNVSSTSRSKTLDQTE